MAGNAGVIQAEISVQIGSALAQLKAITDSFRQLGQSAGAGMRPANEAVDGLSKSFKDFRKDQVQQGRLVGFYVQEVGQFIDVSKGAQSALGGFGGAMLEMASGAGPVALAFAGLELVKGVIGMVREESRRAAEEMKKFVDETVRVVDAGAKAAGALAGKERNRAKTMAGGDPELDDARKEALAAARALQEFKRRFGLLGKDSTSNLSGLSISADQIITWGQLEKKVREATAALRDYQVLKPQNDAAAAGPLGPGNAAGLEAFGRAATRQITEAATAARQLAENLARADMVIAQSEALAYDRGNFPDMAYSEKTWSEMAVAQEPKAYSDREVFGPGNNAGEMQFGKDSAAEAERLGTAWQEVAAAVGNASSAFAGLGAAIGGAAGEMVGKMMEVVVAAIKMAIAIAAASAAQVPIVGWLNAAAAAISLAATMASVLGGVQARELGGPVVPGGTYVVGERGPEILRVGAPGYVTPSGQVPIGRGSGLARSGARGGTTVHVNLNVTAMDGHSVYRTLNASRDQLARVVREAVRDGVMGT